MHVHCPLYMHNIHNIHHKSITNKTKTLSSVLINSEGEKKGFFFALSDSYLLSSKLISS